MLDAVSLRLLDFLAELVDLQRVPSLRWEWQQVANLTRQIIQSDTEWSVSNWTWQLRGTMCWWYRTTRSCRRNCAAAARGRE